MLSSASHLRLAEIEVHASPTDEKIVGVFRYESDSKGKRGPLLLCVAEIHSTLYVYEQLLEVINDTLERLRPLLSARDTDPMARFEKLVQSVNEAVAQFVTEQPSPIAWNRVNIFLVEVLEEHLCLTGLGQLCNIFLQRQSDGAYRAFDLFGSLEQPAEVNPKKIFAGLIYGELKPGDILFAGTQNFERLRQELGLVTRLKNTPPVTAALELQQALEAAHIPDDFGGLILAHVELPEPSIETSDTPTTPSSISSVKRLQAEEKAADTWLGPAITPLTSSSPATPKSGQPTAKIRSRLAAYTAKIKIVLQTVPQNIMRSKKNRADSHDPVTLAGLRTMHAGHGSFLTRKHKQSILTGVVGVVLIVGGGAGYAYYQRLQSEDRAWQSAYAEALDKKNRAEASLVYGDDERAQRLFQESQGIFDRLGARNKKQAQSITLLAQALEDIRKKLRKEQRLEEPRTIFSLPREAGSLELTTVLATGGSVYTFDPFTKQIVTIESTNAIVKRLPWTHEQAPHLTAGTKNTALFLTPDKQVYRVDALEATTKPLAYDTTNVTSLRAAVLYGTRLYALDSEAKMIWRHPYTSAIGPGATYIKQTSEDLTRATSLAIDSNVYVGFDNGKIVRYFSGAQETWQPMPIDPPLKSAAALWASPDSDRLIVADTLGKRLIVLRKDGKLIAQITSPKFTGPKAISVDLSSKQIFVADGQSVYAIDLP